MNFFNKLLLNLVLAPAFLYKKIGADPKHLRLILTTKLTMDDRRPNTYHNTRKKSDKAISGSTLGTMFFSFIFGFFFLYSFVISEEKITQLTIYFSLYIFMLATTLISDFTSVLIDVRDNYIILPKPVTDKTFVLSRLLHIFIHLMKLIVPMSLPALGYMFIKTGGWASLMLLFFILLSTILTIFLINAVYLVILQVSTPAKFQAIISYVQIFIAVFMYASYQLVPRLTNKIMFSGFSFSNKPWAWLLPPYWFATGWQFFTTVNVHYLFGALLSVVIPPFTLWVVIKYFAPSFNQKLSQITGSSDNPVRQKRGTSFSLWPFVKQKLAVLCTAQGEERMGFLLTWNITSRSRDFTLKVYPSIGYLMVYAVVIFLNHKISVEELQRQTTSSKITIISITYISTFIISLALEQLKYSDKYKASWIYFTTPVKKPGLILTGAFKATIIKFVMPISCIVILAGTMVIGIGVVPNLLLGLCNVFLSSLIIAALTVTILPFSTVQNNSRKTGTFIRGLVSMIIPFFLGFLQFIVYGSIFGVLLSCCLSGLASWLLIDYIKNKTWKQLTVSYTE